MFIWLQCHKISIFQKNFLDISYYWSLFEILSRYPNIDGSRCFSEDVQGILDTVFGEKHMV